MSALSFVLYFASKSSSESKTVSWIIQDDVREKVYKAILIGVLLQWDALGRKLTEEDVKARINAHLDASMETFPIHSKEKKKFLSEVHITSPHLREWIIKRIQEINGVPLKRKALS